MTSNLQPEADLRHWLVDYLVTNIGCNPDDVDLDLSLNDLGVGSRDAVVLSGELSELLGRPVSPVEFWQHPTINALAAFLTSPEPDPDEQTAPASDDHGPGNQPIAVIGLGCRFPGGATGPEALWQFMCDGRSAIGEVPDERWPQFDDGSPEGAAALAKTTRWGSFLDEIDAFDAEFFDISPSEATRIDPQQRLLLEVAYEALEHAGIPANSLRRTQTGVFAGACLSEYGYLASKDLSQVDAWTGTGGALSIIANRLSYFLDARGPSVVVDTACSSSLVAVHLACQSLRAGDSDLALAAGVNLLLSPAVTRSFDQAGAMSPTGACHAFDAGADGFVRGEGAGVVVLKRLADAQRDGDRVLAVVRGSAVNQDGRSNGLMAPNPAAQTSVLRAACANAGIEPHEVDYVEAHGTGTLLGDPIEARALGSALGRGRPESAPLLLGAVKTNLGHLEAAAGIAGVIKATLAVQRGIIPPNVGFEVPNPHIPFHAMRLKVVAEQTDWPLTGRPRRAGVSSFGFGGTNAHVVVEQAPDVVVGSGVSPSAVCSLVVSGKSGERVASWAGVLADWLAGAGGGVSLGEVAHTLNHHRARHPRFATVCGRDHADAIAGLRALAAGSPGVGVVAPHEGPCRSGVVFVFSGQGSQWVGMGRRLLVDEPVFAAAVAELEPVFVERVGFSLLGVLGSGEALAGIERIQPVLVGVQLALTALWRSYGVEPDAVVGHSMGEVTAAVVAGALSPAQGLGVIATRSRLMAGLAGGGAMALVELDAGATQELIAGFADVSLAVYASPRQSVIAGPPGQVDAVMAVVAGRDRLARRIEVDVASHHRIIDPVLGELVDALAGLAPRSPVIPVFSTVDHEGDAVLFGADYWAANLRRPVRFEQAIAAAGAEHGTFIEISPHPLLTHAITDTLGDTHHHALGTLQRDTHDTLTFHTNLNTAHTTHPPHTPHPPEPHTPIPTTPWHHTHHWITTKKPAAGLAPRAGTLLGERVTVSSTSAHLWQARLVPEARPYPGHHRLHGVEVVPLSVLLQTILTAATELGMGALTDVRFEHPVVVDRAKFIQVVAESGWIRITSASSADAAADRWTRHVTARISSLDIGTQERHRDIDEGREEVSDADVPSIDEMLAARGVEGRPFDWSVDSYATTSDGLRAQVEVADGTAVALLDAAVHIAQLAGAADSRLYVPATAGEVRFHAPPPGRRGSVSVRRSPGAADEVIVDVSVAHDGGQCISVRSLRFVALEPSATSAAGSYTDPRRFAHTIEWRPRPERADAQAAPPGTAAVLGSGTDGLRQALDGLGHPPASVTDARYVLYVAEPDPSVDETDIDCAARLSAEVTDLVRQLAGRTDDMPVTLWILTRGVREAAGPAAVRQSCLWGLASVVGAEHPEIWGGVVDLDLDHGVGPAESADHAEIAGALTAVLAQPSKSVLALRNGVFHASELVPATGEPVREALQCRPDAAYLVTGGLGALGLRMAGWLADRGARRILLAGRTPLPPRRDWDLDIRDAHVRRQITAIRDLERRGVAVDIASLDIGSTDAVRALIARRDRDGAPPIRGVIHAAGVVHNELLTSASEASMRHVMWPKIAGGQALHDAFPCGTLDFLYLTASAGTVFGIPGQGSYAAANAYLDALARARHRRGCHTVSLDWAAWDGLGFAADAQIVVAELERLGSRPLTAEEAFTAWEYVHRLDIAQTVVVPVPSPTGQEPPPPSNVIDWSQMAPADVAAELSKSLRAIVAGELRTPESELETDRPFVELGLNSMMALSIRREIEQLVGLELSATMLWNYPTVAALANHLAKTLTPQSQTEPIVDDTSPASGASVLDSLFDHIESTPAGSETRI